MSDVNDDLGWLLDADEWENKVYRNKHSCINDWLQRKDDTGKSRRTLNAYSRVAARFFHSVFPERHPSDITVGDIEVYIRELSEREVSTNSKRRYVESLSSFYQWASKRPHTYEEIQGNPAAVVLEELDRVRRERPRTATWENGRKIIEKIPNPRDKAVAVVMAKTGARVKEVISMTHSDLDDLEDGYIHLRDRKGGTNTKNPVDKETAAMLRRVEAVSTHDTYLFSSIRGNRINRNRILREVKKGAVEAGIMESEDETRWHHKFVPHYYRTVFTSMLRNEEPGMDDYWIKYLRGDDVRGDEIDLYSSVPHEKIRKSYLETVKPLNLPVANITG